MTNLTPDKMRLLFPDAPAGAIEEFFSALRDLDDDPTDEHFLTLLDVMQLLNGTLASSAEA